MPVQGALANPAEFERVLTHEFTHALVHSIAPRGVPFWLDEGLAVRFEGSEPEGKRTRVRSAPALLPLPRLETSFATFSAADATLAYAQSAVAVQAMFEQAGGAAIVSLLEAVGSGVPFGEAFERTMLISYPDFQKRLGS